MSLTFKDYKINHIALLLIKVLTLNQKASENSKFSAFDRSNLLLDRSKMKEFITKLLPHLIDSRFLFNRSKSTFNRSKGILDRSRQWRISSWSFCLNWLVLDSSLINWKEHSIDRKEFSIDRNSHNWIFSEFSRNRFWHLHCFLSKHLLILSLKIYKSNIRVFNIKIKNHNNARNLENIIVISLGINFIILALTWYHVYQQSWCNTEKDNN